MKFFRKFLVFVCIFCMFSILAYKLAYSGWRRSNYRPKRGVTSKTKAKTYKYIRSHDSNGDGQVDIKDRLLWIRKRAGDKSTVYVSTENEDIAEVMDLDNDGDVEEWEMRSFYSYYDEDQDGVLEDSEIDEATD